MGKGACFLQRSWPGVPRARRALQRAEIVTLLWAGAQVCLSLIWIPRPEGREKSKAVVFSGLGVGQILRLFSQQAFVESMCPVLC